MDSITLYVTQQGKRRLKLLWKVFELLYNQNSLGLENDSISDLSIFAYFMVISY